MAVDRSPWRARCQDDVRGLIAELNAALLTLTPPEFCYHMTVEADGGAGDDGLHRARGRTRGRLRRAAPAADGIGEVKRMYTRPEIAGAGDRRR